MTEHKKYFWWQQSSAYWELPWYSTFGWTIFVHSTDDWLSAREQLWAIREGLADLNDMTIMNCNYKGKETIENDERDNGIIKGVDGVSEHDDSVCSS